MAASRTIAAAVALGGMIALWRGAHATHCAALFAPAAAALVASWSLGERISLQRRVLADATFRETSWLAPLMRGRLVAAVTASVLGVLLAAALFSDIARMAWPPLFILGFGGFVSVMLIAATVERAAARSVKPIAQGVVVKQLAAGLSFLWLAPALSVAKLYGAARADTDLGLFAALAREAAIPRSDCAMIDAILRLDATRDLVGWRLAVGASEVASALGWGALVALWGVYLLADAVTAFAFCLLAAELLRPRSAIPRS